MEKQKRWQLFVIIGVILLTVYNILPTLIFYSKPLSKPLTEQQAQKTVEGIAERVNQLEDDAVDWIKALCKNLSITPTSVQVEANDPQVIRVAFVKPEEAKIFRTVLPRAGAMVSFGPSQLSLFENEGQHDSLDVHVLRRFGVRLETSQLGQIFQFNHKYADNQITPAYASVIGPRMAEIIQATCGETAQANLVAQIQKTHDQDEIQTLAEYVVSTDELLEAGSLIQQRSFKALSQSFQDNKESTAQTINTLFSESLRKLDGEISAIGVKGQELSDFQKTQVEKLKSSKALIKRAEEVVKKNETQINSGLKPWSLASALQWFAKQKETNNRDMAVWTLVVGDRHPLINEVVLDWGNEIIALKLHPEVLSILQTKPQNEVESRRKDEIERRLSLEIARIGRESGEAITSDGVLYRLPINKLSGSTSIITLDMSAVGNQMSSQLKTQIAADWAPTSEDLQKEFFQILDWKGYQEASPEQKKLCLVVFVPDAQFANQAQLRTTSLYVLGRGFKHLVTGKNEKAHTDIQNLAQMLQARGFVAYLGDVLDGKVDLSQDVVFELDGYAFPLIQATREQFETYSGVPVAVLECSNYEQRLLAQNRIANTIQEDLVRWKDAFGQAQVDTTPGARLYVPKPTQNVFIANLKRATKLYVQGDESKVLRWGLDLSGGKTVKLGLVDQNGKPVTKAAELQQASAELYTRLNKMGVSERVVRVENESITIDFPGLQGVSAQELVQASAMYFHIVNEQFGTKNKALLKDVNDFLQEVWSDAVVTSKKDIDSINEIAFKKLERARLQVGTSLVSSAAERLIENGLVLKNTLEGGVSADFNDSISMVAKQRGDDPTDWYGASHPLIFVFKNYALEGSSLENVHSSYDATKGNILVFGVKSASSSGRSDSPRDDFYQWTSQFAEDKIVGTVREGYSHGNGWRMAVILNGEVISSPTLNVALRDAATISGNFSQGEVQRLATELRAGSLSFTPKILLEQNVSPELGRSERNSAIFASLLGVLSVVFLMVFYYRFAGIVASVAVVFNIFVIWAVMQNIGAAITLPVLAGIVLTVGMAVDANVLVFERIREEFFKSKRIASAIAMGYQKAFSAIVDSNITTILAAVILIQFDSGPIRGFALSLVIGIVASMFTSLFMTKYYFAGWVQNPKHTELKMSKWIPATNIDFLKFKQVALIATAVVFALGILSATVSWRSLLGMDFTGGYSLTVEVEPIEVEPTNAQITPRAKVQEALLHSGLDVREFQVRELGRPDLLRIQLSLSLEQPGRPFNQLASELPGTFTYHYQSNPRIEWIVNALEQNDVLLRASCKPDLGQYWTTMSGQFSTAMRNNAILALVLSLIGVLIYIAVRFEWSYAVSSVVALGHTVLMTLSIMAVANYIGAPLQLNLEAVGALMTIIGYSLNDTIIVFDRVREDVQLYRKRTFAEIVNIALNSTLSRTVMTSGTTLAVLVCLVLFGGSAIFAFSFVMLAGVFIGNLSTIFIASPLLVELQEKGEGTR